MEISQLSFVLLAIYSLTFGLVLGVIYDIIRITRIIIGAESKLGEKWRILENAKLPIINKSVCFLKHSRITSAISNVYVAVGDILFASLCGACSVLIAYSYNSGKIRAVIFLGLLVGFLLYYNTIGRLVAAASALTAFVFRAFVTYVVELAKLAARKISKIFETKNKVKKKGAKNDAEQNGKSKQNIVR